uniref:Endonuclease/exonuclease/phosphatase domain-containing protein n=1 Tax=Dicentrarchus labrax TaxID=13489 RepID=A0A8P4GBE9_DICLA
MGGDFNCYLDPSLDRLSSRAPITIASVQTLNNLLKSRNMIDIWRLQHPTDKGYSYLSHGHKSYTRIDYFLVDAKLISNIVQTKYHNVLISDHSPVSLKLMLALPKQNYCWRFNPWLLTDQIFTDYMSARLGDFLETNDTGDVSDSTLWETLKVAMRGHIISFEASKKREQRRRLVEIENALPTPEQSYRDSLSQEDYDKILKLKYEYNHILSGTIGKLLLKIKQQHFELGDKPERLLARQLKGAQASRAIYKIKSKT